jgi:hypothetical protein
MSGTSELKARVRTSPVAIYNNGGRPIGNIATRYILANNLNHYQDSFGQVRMAFTARSGGAGKDPFVVANRDDQWSLMLTTGTFPIAMREDGSSYRVRVELGGCMESAGPKGRLAVALCPLDRARDLVTSILDPDGFPGTASTDAVWLSGEISGTTPAYWAGQSKGPQAWARMMYLTPAEASRYVVPVEAPVDLGSTDRRGSPQCMVTLSVWGWTPSAGVDVRCHAATLTDWVG